MDDKTLLPCPFCGGEAEIGEIEGGIGALFYASCKDGDCCGYHIDPWVKYARRIEAATAWNTRTTSLAAQDDWTTKRVAELVAEGDGHWRSCTGCHETNEGAETGDYPFNPVFKTYQGGGCGECGGIGVVWDDIDYADYAEFCLNADDDAPSLAAQEVDSGMSGDAVERAEWFWTNLPTGRKWTGLATHEKALVCHQIARITPSPAAQDGLVEAEIDRRVAEERAKLLEQLRGLSLWLGAGSGSDDAAELEKRIRWGVDHQVSSTVQRCADVVERLSKKPGTRWGEVKAAILELQEVQFEKENSHEQG